MEKTWSKYILLIDDDEITNLLNEKLIRKTYNFKVSSFTDASKPLELFKNGRYNSPDDFPDIIFLDINMPLMDGWEFLDEFEKLPDTVRKKCSVIMLTSSIDTNDIEKARRYSSVAEFVSKPLTKDKLKIFEVASQ